MKQIFHYLKMQTWKQVDFKHPLLSLGVLIMLSFINTSVFGQTYATLPYSTGFESGALDASWSTDTDNPTISRIQVTTANTPITGSYHLTMDVNTDNNFTRNGAWLHLNLSGETQVELEFHFKDFADETHTLDGVYFSDNSGTNFTKVFNLEGDNYTDEDWQEFILDVDALASANGLSLNSTFVIKFQQYDNWSIANGPDGFAFDNVTVRVPVVCSPTYASFPYSFDFETGSLGTEWCTKTTSSTSTEVTTTNNPNAGSYHLVMQAATDDLYAQNEAELYIDLSGQTQVELEFYYKDFDDETDTEDGIFLSDDGGSTFTKVFDFNGGSYAGNQYNQVILDIDQLATSNSLTLNGTFVVKFQQYDNFTIENGSDGVGIDDITLRVPTTCSPTYATLPYSTGFETGVIASEWCMTNTGLTRALINTANTAHTGNYHLSLESAIDNNFAQNEGLLHLDLSGETQVDMELYFKDFGDEDHTQDGIYFSDDGGSSFTKVFNLTASTYTDNVWNRLFLDVDNLATTNGLSLTSTFIIKFQQYDNFSIANGPDGFAFDDIVIQSQTCSPTYATLPYATGFESGLPLGAEWCITRNSGNNTQVSTANTPNNGSYHLTMQTATDNSYATNNASLHLDLSGETQVELEFFLKDFDDEDDAEDGVYFSDNGGSSYTKVFTFLPVSYTDNTYSKFLLDVDNLATTNGLSLTSTFVIRFQQRDNYTIAGGPDGLAFDDIVVRTSSCSPTYASFPYSTGFETGALGTEWCVASTGNNNTLVSASNNPRTGTYHLTMEAATDNNYATNEATLYVDLSGETAVELEFYFKDFNDENDTEDGIYFTDDGGSNFTKVFDLNGQSYVDSEWNAIVLDVDDLAATNGLTLNATFGIKFQQRDNYTIAGGPDGFAFDDIDLRAPLNTCSPTYATFPYSEDFESGALGSEWCSLSGANRNTQVSNINGPRSGIYHLTMDALADDIYAQNEALLHIDLSGQTQVELEFYFKEFVDETQNQDGIYFSDDGGSTFTKVFDITGGDYVDETWNKLVIDVDNMATNYGLTLNSTFVIKFQQYDNWSIANGPDGIAFDDIAIRAPASCSPTYATVPYNEGFESGLQGAEWCLTNGGYSRTRISSDNTANTGSYHLTMESAVDNNTSQNEAWLHLDLSGETQVGMDFYFKDFGDEDDAGLEGVFFSDDGGSSFTQVFSISPTAYTDDTWSQITLDVDNLATTNGLSLNSTFVIKFQQTDNYTIEGGPDGFAFDDIRVHANASDWTGNTDNDWNTATNWSNGIPDCTTNVTIPDVSGASGNFPILNAGANGSVGNLTIQNNAQLTIASTHSLSVCEGWENLGNNNIGAGTVIFSGTDLQEISGSTAFQDVTINNTGSGVNLVSDQTVKGILTMTDGILNTQTNTLTFTNGASTTGDSNNSFVIGNMTKVGFTDFVFPGGFGSVWAPIGISNLTGTAATEFSTSYTYGGYPDVTNLKTSDPNGDLNNVSTIEYWDLSNTGVASNADITLYWKDQSRSVIEDYADLVIAHYTGTEWENLGQASIVGSDPGSITVTGVSSFSPFTFGSPTGNNPLPVELISFTASLENEDVLLNWQTASEVNNDFFEIERSETGDDWEVIGKVDGNGTTNEVSRYDYLDNRPLFGTSFYRLRQVDFDGAFEYSNVVSINNPFEARNLVVDFYPNPTSQNEMNLRVITENKENKVFVKLTNIMGTTFFDQSFDPMTFNKDLEIKLRNKINSGIYILVVEQAGQSYKEKIIIE
ncbi:T9SS type A sorting domain-containing protein [Fulvivirgaceae bacterium BMA10]|uniref:T9SS type A sorting domain-containing protein n=1 Tax=Splendidivirga corallicola TaxID=3051826 RepID=A0ABT8KWD4_9BACT|nr:T9SS type A sorting domain-containing protein [Fulvivirgaceae bacterium BMA10]